MKEITVQSPLGQFAAVQMDDDKVDAYIQKHSKLGTWGKPERWTTEPIKGAETRVNEFGETEYLAPAEFTVTITDITEQIAEQEQKESLRSQRKQAEVQKLKAKDLTLEQKVEILWKLAAVDKGVVDLAEDEEDGGKDPGGKMERP